MKSLIPVILIMLVLVLGCGRMKTIMERSSGDYNPYKGNVSDLLKPELSTLSIKFKLAGSRDVTSTYAGAREAKGFTYMQEAGSVSVQVDGALVNFNSATEAEKFLAELAAKNQASLSKKDKGQRFTAKDGAIVAWTNGSLLCVAVSNFAKPAGNFEEAAPF